FNAFRIPDDISDDLASIFDPFGNATHTALSFNLVGEDVLITGAGPIGVMTELRMTEGFDVGMEMSGVPAAFTALLEHMNHGGKVALLGIPPPNMAID